MRIIAVFFVLVMLAGIVGTVSFVMAAAAQRDARMNAAARWRACSLTNGSMTAIELHLKTPDGTVIERRPVSNIFNYDDDYDKQYLNGMEDARNRAFLLNNEERSSWNS